MTTSFSPADAGMRSPIVDSALAGAVEVATAHGCQLSLVRER
jgi:hypothetical protein